MTDTPPKDSLKDFLAKRTETKPATPKATSAPTPQSESSEIPKQMTPAPRAPQKPGMFRQLAGAYASEALKNTGALGRVTAQKVSGVSSRSGMAKAPTYSGTAERVNLSKAKKAPDGKALRGIDDVEQAIILLDQNQREFSQYVASEFKSVREDIEKVSTIASNAAKAVEQLKRDAKANAFKNSVAKGSIRGKNGRFMTSDQADADPDSVGWDPNKIKDASGGGIFDTVWGYAKQYGAYAAGGAATLYGAKKASGLATNLARRKAGEKAAEIVTKKAGSAFMGNVAKSVVGGKGGGIGTGIAILQTMKKDSESGNHLRSWLRGKLGIEDDPDELAPWQKNADGTPKKKDAVRAAPKTEDNKIDSPDSIEIESKKSISMTAVQDIKFEARNEFTIKARTLIIDAEKIEFKGNAKFGDGEKISSQGGGGTPSRPPLMSTPLDTSEQRYDENVAKYGRVKADELQALDNRWTDPSNIVKKATNLIPGFNKTGATGSGVNVKEAGEGPKGQVETDGSMKGDDLRKGVYNAFRAQGYSHQGALTMAGEVNRENGFNPNLVFGNHSDPHNGAKNSGMFSWQGSRNPELMKHLESRGALDENGNIKRDQNALNAQAEFVKMEMGKKEYGGGRLNEALSQEKFDRNAMADDIGKNYIKWRVDDPTYRSGGVRNRDAGYESTRRAVEDGRPSKSAAKPGGLAELMKSDQKPSASAVDLALRNEGMHEREDRQAIADYLRKGPNGVNPATTPWCAAYVNSSLQQAGVQGTGSAIANSFQRWGVPVPDASKVEKGDVVINTNGLGPNDTGGHVGMATGSRRQREDGTTEFEMVSGNKSDMVKKSWETMGGRAGTMVRRDNTQYPAKDAEPVGRPSEQKIDGAKVMVNPGSPAVAPGFQIGKGQIAGHVGEDGKLSGMATMMARDKIISGMGENFSKLPKDVQEHLKNASQLDLNKLAPYQNLMPEDMKKGFADNGLTFTPGKDAIAPTYKDAPEAVKNSDGVVASRPSPITTPVQALDDAGVPDADPAQSDMAKSLGGGDLDKASDADMIRGIPTPPNLSTNDDPDAGQRVTDSIKSESEVKTEKGSTVSDQSAPSSSAQTGRSSAHDIQAPVNHPESEAPRPGSDGYGDQQHDPDDCGLCAT
jgi:uncharacterized protein (TIGR02594 family)